MANADRYVPVERPSVRDDDRPIVARTCDQVPARAETGAICTPLMNFGTCQRPPPVHRPDLDPPIIARGYKAPAVPTHVSGVDPPMMRRYYKERAGGERRSTQCGVCNVGACHSDRAGGERQA